MKELLYVHAGTSHIASHFFNAQQAQFTYDDREDEVPVDHDVSFREGQASDGSQTYCPRLMLFDSKANFGSLANVSALQTDEESISADTWSGGVVEHRQDPIPQSEYHKQLDAAADAAAEDAAADPTSSVRFWSDYSRVFFHPRGLHRVPDLAEWQREVGWAQGAERFTQYDTEHNVMEDSFRPFAEECDILQGIQLTFDAPSFGSFMISFLSQFRDEYPKLPLLSFCTLSPTDPAAVDLNSNDPACMNAINDALTLQELASLSTITVPLQHPTTWSRGRWSNHLDADFTIVYHSSALLAAHIENATLPLRLKSSMHFSTDLATIGAHLNWRGDTPFAALSGALPLPVPESLQDLETCIYDFSHHPSTHEKYKNPMPFAQRDIFRGLYPHEQDVVRRLFDDEKQPQPRLRSPLLSISYINFTYPIPTSHPQFFKNLDSEGRDILSPTHGCVRAVPLYTSLRTTPRTAVLAGGYARLLDGALTRRLRALDELGAERETVDEAREGWWKWVGAYGPEEDEKVDERGEDEEDV